MIKMKNIYTSCLYVSNTMISSNYISPLPPQKNISSTFPVYLHYLRTHLVPWVSQHHNLLTNFYQILVKKLRTHRGVSCFLLKFILHRVEAASSFVLLLHLFSCGKLATYLKKISFQSI